MIKLKIILKSDHKILSAIIINNQKNKILIKNNLK